MLSYITFNLLITITAIYYNKIVGEDKENVLTHVFDKKYLPDVQDSNIEIGVKKSKEKLKDLGIEHDLS